MGVFRRIALVALGLALLAALVSVVLGALIFALFLGAAVFILFAVAALSRRTLADCRTCVTNTSASL